MIAASDRERGRDRESSDFIVDSLLACGVSFEELGVGTIRGDKFSLSDRTPGEWGTSFDTACLVPDEDGALAF